jgi:hypothetical protein
MHQELGHVSKTKMHTLLRQNQFPKDSKITKESIDQLQCVACIQGTMTRQPFNKRSFKQRRMVSKTYAYAEKMEADISGPHPESIPDSNKYYILVFDCASKMIFIRVMTNLKRIPELMKEIFIEIQSLQPTCNLGTIKFDEASVFKSAAMKKTCIEPHVHSILQYHIVTPQTAEPKHPYEQQTIVPAPY